MRRRVLVAMLSIFCTLSCRRSTKTSLIAITPEPSVDAAACGDPKTDSKHCGRCNHDCLGGKCEAGVCAEETIASVIAVVDPWPSRPDRRNSIVLHDDHVYWVAHERSPPAATLMRLSLRAREDSVSVAHEHAISLIGARAGALFYAIGQSPDEARLVRYQDGKEATLFEEKNLGSWGWFPMDDRSIHWIALGPPRKEMEPCGDCDIDGYQPQERVVRDPIFCRIPLAGGKPQRSRLDIPVPSPPEPTVRLGSFFWNNGGAFFTHRVDDPMPGATTMFEDVKDATAGRFALEGEALYYSARLESPDATVNTYGIMAKANASLSTTMVIGGLSDAPTALWTSEDRIWWTTTDSVKKDSILWSMPKTGGAPTSLAVDEGILDVAATRDLVFVLTKTKLVRRVL